MFTISGPKNKAMREKKMGIAIQYASREARKMSKIRCCWVFPPPPTLGYTSY